MENQIFLSKLFDYYSDLLSDRQRQYFKDYYFDNFTLGEMSENYQISRNAIHKTLKEATERLLYYEDKLKLLAKYEQIKIIIDKLDDDIKNKILELI